MNSFRPDSGSPELENAHLEGLHESSTFVFENGDPLYNAPDVPIAELFGPTIDVIEERLERFPIVIATAPSGVGKTELLLEGKFNDFYGCGLRTRFGDRYLYLDGQSRALAQVFKGLASDEDLSDKRIVQAISAAEIIAVDEFVAVQISAGDSSGIAVTKLIDSGKKFVLVGGGLNATAVQMQKIESAFEHIGYAEGNIAKVAIPAFVLNNRQVVEIMERGANGRKLDEQLTEQLLARVDELGLPKVFRMASFLPTPVEGDTGFIEGYIKGLRASEYKDQVGHILNKDKS